MVEEGVKTINASMNTITIEGYEASTSGHEDIHSTRPHWCKLEWKLCILTLVMALIDHALEINLMSIDFYKRGSCW